jgi:tripartite-type tricarboxylate transporter receptor subunit TctC
MIVRLIALSILWLTAAAPAWSQSWPQKPLRIMVIAAPGGYPDIAARILAAHLSPLLGQPLLVENRAGGGGNIASAAVAKAAPDGYTLLLTGNNHAVNPTLLPDPGFDYEKDFAPVSMISQATMIVVTSPALGVKSVSEVIALAKSRPAKSLALFSGIVGTPNHLSAELFAQMSGVDFTFVTYKGISPALPDLMSGQLHVAIISLPSVLQMVKAGKLPGIAVTRTTRSAFLPDAPTVAESGLPGFDVNAWVCILTTGGTPRPVVQRLNTEIRKAMATREAHNAFMNQGTEPWTTSPEDLEAYIRAETAKWRSVLKNAKVRE